MKDEGEENDGFKKTLKILRNDGEKEELRVSEFNDNLNYSKEENSNILRASS